MCSQSRGDISRAAATIVADDFGLEASQTLHNYQSIDTNRRAYVRVLPDPHKSLKPQYISSYSGDVSPPAEPHTQAAKAEDHQSYATATAGAASGRFSRRVCAGLWSWGPTHDSGGGDDFCTAGGS